ncbi:MAG: hypothetical protein ACE5HJ_08830, partial [Thermoplasmata archaeon]
MRWHVLFVTSLLVISSIALFAVVPRSAVGDAATLMPDSDISTAAWTPTPLWQRVDENVDSPDGATISASSKNEVAKLGQTDSPVDVDTVTAVNLRVRANSSAGSAHQLQVELRSSDEATTYASFQPTMSTTMTTYSSGDITVSMTKAQIDDAILRIQTIDTGQPNAGTWEVDALNNDITYTAAPCAAITVTTSDPSGQLWFNETVEPDGQPYTTQYNVSASFQDGTTPAIRVTNDGAGTCDITIRLMSDPGTGRSMKYNTTNSAPWPGDASRDVPV